jgi:hypothetical protein
VAMPPLKRYFFMASKRTLKLQQHLAEQQQMHSQQYKQQLYQQVLEQIEFKGRPVVWDAPYRTHR